LLKEDTTGVELYLKRPCEECDFERISFSSPNVVWTPATSESDFRVEYQPGQLEDGIYTIKAQASDASGNKSGATAYTVSFEVINESQITNFFPYPNPFSSSTRFVFTLTGSEIPDQIIIQIMTVNGTVVREITQDEIGPIRIGHNKTQYAWDGKDEYGDQLANGVYLYRVKVLMHGEDIKLRPTSADKAFKHGFGKMYLLR
jgi:flagellar hook assembly protein FlgD